MTIEAAVLAAVVAGQGALGWGVWSAARSMRRLEKRIERQGDALALMTETSEAGFAAVARELERLAVAAAKPDRRTSTRRVTTAVRKGNTIADIAAAEGISEGEVRLRLSMSKPQSGSEGGRGTLRS
jgi:hypothetical protein